MSAAKSRQRQPLYNKAPKIENQRPKAENFSRLASQRISATVQRMRMLQYLGNRAVYEYTEAQVNKIEQILLDEVEAVMRKLREPIDRSQRAKPSFTI